MNNDQLAFSELYSAVKALASMVGDIAMECGYRGLLVSRGRTISESYSRVLDHLSNAHDYMWNTKETDAKLSGVTEI